MSGHFPTDNPVILFTRQRSMHRFAQWYYNWFSKDTYTLLSKIKENSHLNTIFFWCSPRVSVKHLLKWKMWNGVGIGPLQKSSLFFLWPTKTISIKQPWWSDDEEAVESATGSGFNNVRKWITFFQICL